MGACIKAPEQKEKAEPGSVFFCFGRPQKNKQKKQKVLILKKAEKAGRRGKELKTLEERMKENEKRMNCFYEKASEMLAEARTPKDIQEAYEYIRKERKKIADEAWKK